MIIIALLLHFVLLSQIRITSYPEFFLYPYLVNSGLTPYRQIVDQHSPGLLLSPINFQSIGIDSPEKMEFMFIFLSLCQTILIYIFIYKVSTKRNALIGAFLHAISQPIISQGSLWYETFLGLLLSILLLLSTVKKWFSFGIVLSFLVLWKQTALIFFIPAMSYVFSFRKKTNLLVTGLGLVLFPALFLFYLYRNSALSDFFKWGILFNFTGYSSGLNQIPIKIIMFFLLTALSSFFILRYDFQKPMIKMLLTLFVFSFVSALPRFDLLKLQSFIPVLIIVLSLAAYKSKLGFIVMLFTLFFVSQSALKITPKSNIYNFFSSDITEISRIIDMKTPNKSQIFILGAQPHIYSLSKTIPTGNYFIYQLPWYLKEEQQTQLDVLSSKKPNYVLIDHSANIDNQGLSDYAGLLLNFTYTNYFPVSTISSLTLYEKNY